jgi:antitoxin MazE
MRTRIQKWGNSLAVRIPKPFAEGAGLSLSTEVEVSLENGSVRVEAVRHRWRLRQLLDGVTRKNRRSEVNTGPRAGRESW